MFLNDFETYVRIDADDVVEFAKSNREYFLRELGVEDENIRIASLKKQIENLLNDYDSIRRDRDYKHADTDAVKLYEALTKLKDNITID